MNIKMNIQIKQLFTTYEQSKELVAEHTYMQQSFAIVQNMFEDKRNKPDANIMVYGRVLMGLVDVVREKAESKERPI